MLFIQNKYTIWYYKIIENAKSAKVEGYTEKHHIIPRSLGGSDDPHNMVVLTARQHFICHLLLPKMVSSKNHRHKMIKAVWAMTTLEYSMRQERYSLNSKSYEYARRLFSKTMSENNPMHNPETSAKRVETWKKNRANKQYIEPRVLKDKFITPFGVFKTKRDIIKILHIPEHTVTVIYNNLDATPTSNGRRSKQISHLNLDYTKSWRDNGFSYI